MFTNENHVFHWLIAYVPTIGDENIVRATTTAIVCLQYLVRKRQDQKWALAFAMASHKRLGDSKVSSLSRVLDEMPMLMLIWGSPLRLHWEALKKPTQFQQASLNSWGFCCLSNLQSRRMDGHLELLFCSLSYIYFACNHHSSELSADLLDSPCRAALLVAWALRCGFKYNRRNHHENRGNISASKITPEIKQSQCSAHTEYS